MAKSKYTKRPDGRYQANIFVGYDDTTKRRKYVSVYARTVPELERLKADILSNVNKGTYANDKKMTVKDLAEKWYMTEKAVCGIRTKEMYERITYKHIIPSIGPIRLRELKKSDVQLMINERADRHRTCQQLRMAVKQMLEFAIEDGLIYKNVANNISIPEIVKSEKRGLNDMEKKAIKETKFTDKERAFVYLLLYTGLRRGEALGLSTRDINFKTMKISVRNVVTFDGSKPVLKEPKTQSGSREVPITSELEKILRPYIDTIKTLYLFETENGGLMPKSTYDDFWRRIISKINKAAGGNDNLKVIHGLSAHTFRHNYATMLYYAGVPIKDAQYLLGHSNIKITLDIYTHLDKNKSEVANLIHSISAL